MLERMENSKIGSIILGLPVLIVECCVFTGLLALILYFIL